MQAPVTIFKDYKKNKIKKDVLPKIISIDPVEKDKLDLRNINNMEL